MVISKVAGPAGSNWAELITANNFPVKFFTATSGRAFGFGKSTDGVLIYSDDNCETFQSYQLEQIGLTWGCEIRNICETSTGRLIATITHDMMVGYGIFYSDNNGSTWYKTAELDATSLCITPSGKIITDAWSRDTQSLHLYESADNGITFVDRGELPYTGDTLNKASNYFFVSSTGRLFYYTGSNYIYYSDDSNYTWTRINNLNGTMNIVELSTGRLVSTGKAGIHTSDDDGVTWFQQYYANNVYFTDSCVTDNDRIVLCEHLTTTNTSSSIKYIDNPMITPYTLVQALTFSTRWSYLSKVANGKLIASKANTTLYYSNPAVESTVVTKYLNKPAVQELVTQFKAYVQSKK